MAKTKILCMADGGLTPDIFQRMKDLEKSFDCEVTIMVDESISTYTKTMDRMHECEYEGIKAAVTYPPLLEAVKDADILCVHMTSVNREVIEAGKNLKIVDCMRGGFENVDIKACTEHGIIMINSSWRSAPAVAGTTIGMMIAENKNIARSHLAIVQGGWRKQYKNQAYIRNMDRCTVGIIGFGYIGRQVVRRLKGFGCKILVYDPFLDPKVITDAGETFAPLDELLEKSDFVSLHIRLSEKTHHWFGAEQFAKMKPTAYFINLARSGIVDTAALIKALQDETIGGAALDVFDEEPLPADSPFRTLDNVTLLSHMAGTSGDTMACSIDIGFDDISRFLRGEPMENVRNPEVLDHCRANQGK